MSEISERNPFVGPRPIQPGEPLHGRDREVRELYNRLQARRIVVLHSPSGAGKSSLVHAGLIPRLRKGGFDVWKPIRVNLDPKGLEGVDPGVNRYLLSAMVSLEEELPQGRRRPPAELAGMELLDYAEHRPRRKGRSERPVVLLFDQFEEVLTVDSRAVEAKREFFSAVGELLDTGRYWALFIIREDYLPAVSPYRDRIPTQLSNTFRLDLLGPDGARDVAVKLVEGAGRVFPGVDQLIHDLSMVQVQQPDGTFELESGLHVEPVHLQVVGRRMWAAMPDDDLSIDDEDVDRYADIATALGGYYADSLREIAGGNTTVERQIRDWVGHSLIMDGVRSQVRQEAGRSGGLDNGLIDGLRDHYLVRTEQRAGSNWFELGHDRMVEPVLQDNRRWEQEHLHPLQVQAKLWERGNRAQALLLRAEAIPQAVIWVRTNDDRMTEEEREFFSQSRTLRSHEIARKWGVLVIFVTVVAVAIGVTLLAVFAWEQRDEAQTKAELAEQAQALAAEEAQRAHTASLMAGARELLARGRRGPAAMVLGEVEWPEEVSGWAQAAIDTLGGAIPESTMNHEGHVRAAAWSPDGSRIATVAAAVAMVWDPGQMGEPVVLRGHEDTVSTVGWGPQGRRLATGSDDGTARIWAADGSGTPVVLHGHEGPITDLAWSAGGDRVATASADGTARVWAADGSGAPVVLRGHEGPVMAVGWAGERIVTTSHDATVRVWNADGAGQPQVLHGHEERLGAMAWSPDAERLVTVSDDGTARVWSLASGAHVVLRGHTGPVVSAAWNSEGDRIVTASADMTARIWRPDRSAALRVLRGHGAGVLAACWSPDGERVATASGDGTTRIWSMADEGPPLQLRDHKTAVRDVVWSPDGTRVVTASDDDTARLWNLEREWVPAVLEGAQATAYLGTPSPDGTRVVTVQPSGTLKVATVDGAGSPVVLRGHQQTVEDVAWSPDGTRLVSASANRTARMWRADGSGEPRVWKSPQPVHAVGWSPDGTRVALGLADGRAHVHQVDGDGEPQELSGHEDGLTDVAWSPDGAWLATASLDTTARIWPADGSAAPVVLGEHRAGVQQVVWNDEGTHLATVSDETARLWRADGTEEPVSLLGHEGRVESLRWSADGLRIVTASADRSVRVWPVDGEREPLVLGGHEKGARDAWWSADGKTIISVSGRDVVRNWTIEVPQLARALHQSTSDCLDPRQRRGYLAESDDESQQGFEACERAHHRSPDHRQHR